MLSQQVKNTPLDAGQHWPPGTAAYPAVTQRACSEQSPAVEGDCDGDALGDPDGTDVGDAVGALVGAFDGDVDGNGVGMGVGFLVVGA